MKKKGIEEQEVNVRSLILAYLYLSTIVVNWKRFRGASCNISVGYYLKK